MNTNKIYANLIKTNPLEKKFGFADDQLARFWSKKDKRTSIYFLK